MAYSREDIIEQVNAALGNPATLYTKKFIKYTESVGGVRYTEIAASRIAEADSLTALSGIPTISRKKSYKTKTHAALAERTKPDNSRRDEEWIAKKDMYGKSFKRIGKVLDFQIPLKDTSDDSVGKIDLLSYNQAENTAYILELKKPGSEETLLRCVLESYTYWQTVDREKLLRDFQIEGAELRKGVLVFKDCVAYEDFQGDVCNAVKSLMCDKLHVDLFVLHEGDVIEGYKH